METTLPLQSLKQEITRNTIGGGNFEHGGVPFSFLILKRTANPDMQGVGFWIFASDKDMQMIGVSEDVSADVRPFWVMNVLQRGTGAEKTVLEAEKETYALVPDGKKQAYVSSRLPLFAKLAGMNHDIGRKTYVVKSKDKTEPLLTDAEQVLEYLHVIKKDPVYAVEAEDRDVHTGVVISFFEDDGSAKVQTTYKRLKPETYLDDYFKQYGPYFSPLSLLFKGQWPTWISDLNDVNPNVIPSLVESMKKLMLSDKPMRSENREILTQAMQTLERISSVSAQ